MQDVTPHPNHVRLNNEDWESPSQLKPLPLLERNAVKLNQNLESVKGGGGGNIWKIFHVTDLKKKPKIYVNILNFV